MTEQVVVIGGGVAGLSAAYTLYRRGAQVRLLEAGEVVGGKVRSNRVDGFLIEQGPHSFLGRSAPIWQLLGQLGISGHAMQAEPPAWRFVHRGGRTRRLPVGLWSALTGDWLSLSGKLRASLEPWITAQPGMDESVRSFFARRFGAEVADALVAPFVSGIYAGDAAQIGLADAFPALAQMEQNSGSVIRAALGKRSSGPKGMFSLRDGMATLPKAMADALGDSVSLRCAAHSLERDGRAWVVHTDQGERLRTERVIIAAPPSIAAKLLTPHGVEGLEQVQTCPVALVHVGGVERQGAARGFGALIPRGQGVRALGLLLSSSLFRGRAPAGRASMAVFFGGSQDPEAAALSRDELLDLALRARRKVFASELEPEMCSVVRWPQAIVQYRIGHRAAMSRVLDEVHATLPGVTLAGAHLHGVSVSDACASGMRAAVAVSASLGIDGDSA